ncbi:MAG TPA: hypothetical protein PLX06_08200, partial [Fimbriimonadaceae bacterium]|nr:hypothetical protein [Fimbriimonadaceae bacterium]
AGTATLNGTYRVSDRALDLNAFTTGIDLSDLHSQVAGTAIGRFRVSGTAKDFVATGPIELYGLDIQGQLIPLVAGDVSLSRQGLLAENVRASKGAGRLFGNIEWLFDSGALDGRFRAEGLQLHDFVEEGVEGGLDLREGVISGTVEKPVLEASLALDDLIAQEIRFESGSGRAKLDGRTIYLSDARVQMGSGTLRLDGQYGIEEGRGEVRGTLEGLPLDRIQPLLPDETVVQGSLDGQFVANLDEKRLSGAEVEGKVNRLEVNGAFFGSGPIKAAKEGDDWRGDLTIGQPERYFEAANVRYRPETRELEASISALDLPVRNLFFAARPYLVEARTRSGESPTGADWIQTLDGVQGRLDVAADVSGKIDDLSIDVQTLLLRETSLNGDETGQIEAAARRESRRWTLQKLRWTGGPGILDLKGTLEEEGNINLDGNLNNFDTTWLAQFVPSLARLSGDASLFFSVTGDTVSPKIEASLSGSFFEVGAGTQDPDKRLNLEIYPILVEEGAISLEGRFQYRGFSGTLKGTSPFQYPATIPDDKPVDLVLTVDSRPLSDLKELIREIDAEKSKGSVSADIHVHGPRGAIAVDGKLEVKAENLYFEDFGYGFEGVSLVGAIDNDSLDVALGAKTSRGGSVDGKFELALGNLAAALQESTEQLLSNQVKGNLYLRGIQIDERQDEYGSLSTTVNGALNLTGTVSRPVIATFVPIAFENVRGVVPSVFAESASAEQGPIRPEFRVAYIIGTRRSPAHVAATSSDLQMYGSGTLTGRYPSIKADAALTISSGLIRLPNARIRLLEGGKVRAIYDASLADPELRLDVDIEGRTSLSTLRYTNLVERYEIFLDIRGNLLDPAEQLITARSDPPDLTSERILSLLGQIELFQTLSGQFTGGQNRTELERTLAGIALPVVFDPVTEAIAKQFGLEYLSINYGPLGQTDVTLAKWLGKGFTIQGRREISDPIDGVPDYDIRLTYRPPRSIRTLRDLVFSIGVDQDRPWKIAIEYGKRFRNGGAANASNVIRIGPEPPPKP